ncbi:cyclic GMP-AMP synthase [Nannospalax galili]|uniref:cyclic GMP-AMP synthase n=1 Tax=Nannospalax galili TaxID=1026970 RepID=UPI0004ED10BC|nr:cyclic GMP-AMP synthase [Nannospalax galili]
MDSRRVRTTWNSPRAGAAGADAWEPGATDTPAEPSGTRAARPHAGSCGRARGARSLRAECTGASTGEPPACAPGARPGRASVRAKDAQPTAPEPPADTGSREDAAGPHPRRGARSRRGPSIPTTSGEPGACAPPVSPGRASVRRKDAPRSTAGDTEHPEDEAGPRRGRGARSRPEPSTRVASGEPRARGPRARPGRALVRTKDAQPATADEAPALPERDPEQSASPEPPAVAAGPRPGRGARSVREPRAPPTSRELRARSLGLREVASDDWNPRPVLDKLRLRRAEISVAAKVVNGVVAHLLRRVRNRESEFKDLALMNTGSYYEHVKISAPNEFDVMFKLEVPRIELQEYCNTGAYYFVKFKRLPNGNPLNQFLEEEMLSASKMLSKFRKIIEEEVKNIKGTEVSVEEGKPGSPAVTLLIRNPEEISVDIILALESKGSWPASTKEGLPIESWLGRKVRTKLRLEPFYLVPKNAKEGDSFQGETWRLSFSHTEKYILNNHGTDKTCCEADGVKCCRKECLKLMKYLLEQLKKEFEELDKFCSYHVKTAIFHMWTENPQDSQWDPKLLSSCFLNFVTYFIECLKTEKLEHFFIPKFNLFSEELVDTKSKEFLSKKIEYERNNRFPIFDKC